MQGNGKSGRGKRRKKTADATDTAPGAALPILEPGVESVPPEEPVPARTRARAPRATSGSRVSRPARNATRPPETDREAVLAANAMFYRAFEVRDLDLMGQLWAHAPYVRCIHPGSEPLYGWEEVIGSWAQIFAGMETLRFQVTDVSVRVGGDLAWVELCESLEAIHDGRTARSQVLATNLFERGADRRWRLVHHHASPVMVRRTVRPGGTSLH